MTTHMSIAKIITQDGITVLVKGYAPFTMTRSHKYYEELVHAVNESDVQGVLEIIDIAQQAANYLSGKVEIRNGEVFYEGEALTGALVDRILQFMSEGLDANYLLKFLENLMQNPSRQSREELYGFLESCGDLPITEDGRFIAFKWVREDGFDVHSGTNHHEVGKVISMPRSKVDDNRMRTCSYGLHVCSSKYTRFGQRIFLVAINPKDVVSVPYDYDNSKMRVAEYEVIEELSERDYTEFSSAVYAKAQEASEYEGYEEEEEEDDDDGFDPDSSYYGRY